MSREPTSYNIYMDESGWKDQPNIHFGSVAAITLPQKSEIYEKVKGILPKKEIKWREMDTHNKLIRALKFIEKFRIGSGGLRVDVLTWRKKDKLNLPIKKQYKDKKVLGIMYYHLVEDIIKKVEIKKELTIYPDKTTHMDKEQWLETEKFIQNHRSAQLSTSNLKIEFEPKESKTEIFIQVADFMAGFMRETWELSCTGKKKSHRQELFFHACEEVINCLNDLMWKQITIQAIPNSNYQRVNYFTIQNSNNFGYISGIWNRANFKYKPINFWRFRPKWQSDSKLFSSPPDYTTKPKHQRTSKNNAQHSPSLPLPYTEGINVLSNPPKLPSKPTLTL